ncbi:hypothetical protein DZC73_08065 [Albitalea terrae]|uniref:Uncharacterized protein n=1 Tax=Piscinibacter terrae TaxID=2496871 RepID=A0A3N7HRK3_9BURK|nr:hypothetical protein DZC73_08065 [Albitalea terrae]
MLLQPLVLLNRLLTSDFKLRRQGGRLRVVVEQPARSSRTNSQPAPVSRPAPAADIELTMQIELRHLLTQHNGTRRLMRHLGYIERALRKDGPEALDGIPLEVLSKGFAQLKSIVTDWSCPGLSELRSRLSILIAAKEEEARSKHGHSRLSDFFTTTRLQVSEATPSDFVEVQKTWSK